MQIRRITAEDRLASDIVSAVSFHGTVANPEERQAEYLADENYDEEDWGAFDDDGTLMAHVINNHLDAYIDGSVVSNGGIGGVSTLPAYRNTGAIRAIFGELLKAAYARGEVISSLYPFSHVFYRKFGYETVNVRSEYRFSPYALKGFRHDGRVSLWKEGDDVAPFRQIYDVFACRHNLAVARGDGSKVGGVYTRDKKFCYLLYGADGAPCSYVIFKDEQRDGGKLSVQDAAWSSPDGFRSLLGFLGRFGADYTRIRMYLPTGVELLSILPEAYDVEKNPSAGYMVRAVNAEKLLGALKTAGSFTIAVADNIIPENNGCFAVGDGVAPYRGAADLTVSAGLLAQLVSGALSLDEALYCGAVLRGNGDVLRATFVRKSLYIADNF